MQKRLARRWRLVTLAGAVLATLALVAWASGAVRPGASQQAAAKFKVAILLPGSPTDHGYNADGARTAAAIRKLGTGVTVSEGVSVPNQADVYRQFASKGYNLVIGWGDQFTDGAVQVAKEFPQVKFLVVNSNVSNGKNLASYDQDPTPWEFLGGYVLAKLSKTRVVGYVGAQCFPGTAKTFHGAQKGALYANPRIKFLFTFTQDFEDPTKAQQAAQAMIERGADGLTGNLNNGWFGVYRAAEAGKNIHVITEWTDNHQQAPKVIVSSILKSQTQFVVQVVKTAINGTWKGKFYLFTLPKNFGPAISKTPLLPESVYKQALAVQAKIVSGQLKPKTDTSCPK